LRFDRLTIAAIVEVLFDAREGNVGLGTSGMWAYHVLSSLRFFFPGFL
jgi:hypothetical protein